MPEEPSMEDREDEDEDQRSSATQNMQNEGGYQPSEEEFGINGPSGSSSKAET